jgi:RNA polymerase sigma-70 factor (ECF subfamily)
MRQRDQVVDLFEADRRRLRAVAYRMLGSLSDADDAVQEAWIRLGRTDADQIENLSGWLTTVVARICLDVLRTRGSRREEPLEVHLPEPVIDDVRQSSPENEALVADAVGLALLVVVQELTPPERLAFVLHDMFGVPFDDIAAILARTPTATRQLASRARRRVRGTAPRPDVDLVRQREVVDAFFAAARVGDLEGLVAVLDPDVVLRADAGAGRPGVSTIVRGAREVAQRAVMFSGMAPFVRPALVNGAAGVVVVRDGDPFSVMGFIVMNGRIVEIDALADRERLRKLDLASFDD